MRRELCTRAVGSAPCRRPACVLAHSPREPPSLVSAIDMSVWTCVASRLHFRRYAISRERRPAPGHARLNPCAGEIQSMQGVQTRSPGYAPRLCGDAPRRLAPPPGPGVRRGRTLPRPVRRGTDVPRWPMQGRCRRDTTRHNHWRTSDPGSRRASVTVSVPAGRTAGPRTAAAVAGR